MMRLVLLVFLFILSAGPACTPLAQGSVARLPATGIDGAWSRQVVVAEHGHTVMVGQVLILRQAGRTALAVEVGQLPDGAAGRLRMDSAWHEGQRLSFRAIRRNEPFCTAPGRCQGFRTGTFALSRAEFDAALQSGLSATLIGPDAVVEVHFPPALFVEARDQARTLGLWP